MNTTRLLKILTVGFVIWLVVVAFFVGYGLRGAQLIAERQRTAHFEELLEASESLRSIDQGRTEIICKRAPDACKNLE